MMRTAPRSSRMASAVSRTFSAGGTREPRMASTASEKAMSVAEGTAQPLSVSGEPALNPTKISAGTSMPPAAARPGSTRRGQVDSSPSTSSRLISSPTRRKNTVIRPSLTAWSRLTPKISRWTRRSYACAIPVLATIRASAAAASRTSPPATSFLRNRRAREERGAIGAIVHVWPNRGLLASAKRPELAAHRRFCRRIVLKKALYEGKCGLRPLWHHRFSLETGGSGRVSARLRRHEGFGTATAGMRHDRKGWRRDAPGLRPGLAAILLGALLLAGCNSFLGAGSPGAGVTPAAKTLTASGPAEHARIVAAYGGIYHDPKLEQTLARIVGRVVAASDNPSQNY